MRLRAGRLTTGTTPWTIGPTGLNEYLLSQRDSPALERSRLRLVQQYHDPLTARQLDAIRVREGWRCVDVGAGGGTVTRMLAERVGPTGSVLALDVDTGLLEPLTEDDRIEVRRHDLRSDSLPDEAFDLAHARLLLTHLPSRLVAVRRLARAVRPGGWVAAIDPDFTTVGVSPTSLVWERTWSIFCDAIVAGGWDPRYGARLYGDLRSAGLVEVQADYVASCDPGGWIVGCLLSLTLERLRERMVALGADSEEIDESRRQLEDPTNRIHSPTSCVARARRPPNMN